MALAGPRSRPRVANQRRGCSNLGSRGRRRPVAGRLQCRRTRARGRSRPRLEAWDVRRGKLLLGPIDVAALGYPIDVSGARIVLGNFDGTVALYDLERPRAQPDYLGGHRGSVVSTSLGPDDLLATVDNRGTAILWRTDRVLTARSPGRRFNELESHLQATRAGVVRASSRVPSTANVEIRDTGGEPRRDETRHRRKHRRHLPIESGTGRRRRVSTVSRFLLPRTNTESTP